MSDNEIIAEFMGLIRDGKGVNQKCFRVMQNGLPSKNSRLHESLFKYQTSWNWLMPVVEKIETVPVIEGGKDDSYIVTIETRYCVISENGEAPVVEGQAENEETKITTVYNTVVEFIKWYNQTK